MVKGITLVLPLVLFSFLLKGQNQLVLLNGQKVLMRYVDGDDFVYKPKKSKKFVTKYITDIQEFYIVNLNDTIPFSSIERVRVKGNQSRGISLLSKFLITAGVTYFVLDQFNNVVVQGQKADMDPSVWKPSLIMVVTGLALKLIHKRSQEVRFPARLMMVSSGSPFYLEEK